MIPDILVVDDQKDICHLIRDILRDEGYQVRTAHEGNEALEAVRQFPPHLVILDIWLNNSRLDGVQILDILQEAFPETIVVMISGHANIETAITCVKKGAYDFIEKPFQTERLLGVIQKGLALAEMKKELNELRSKMSDSDEMKGTSAVIEVLRKTALRIAKSNTRIFIDGEPGCGKSLLARFIHDSSDRKQNPFIPINCALFNGSILLAELFGIEKMTNNRVTAVKIGAMEKANGGTIYLENIHDLHPDLQGRLLQFLHDGKVRRVGSTTEVQVDVRIISSAPKPLDGLVQQGEFRSDLFYRLCVTSLSMPSLAEHMEDIPLLANTFLRQQCQLANRSPLELSIEALTVLRQYTWPGNVRQLRNVMEWLTIMMPDNSNLVQETDLPADVRGVLSHDTSQSMSPALLNLPLREAREHFERTYLSSQLYRCGGSVARTAQVVGMDRTALHRKLKMLNLEE